MITLCKPNFAFVCIKSKKQVKETDTNFVILGKKYFCAIHENEFAKTSQGPSISHIWENSKMLKIISKYFSFLKIMPPVS